MSRLPLLHGAFSACMPALVLGLIAAPARAADPTWTTIAAPFTAGANTGTPDGIGLADAPDGTAYATATFGDGSTVGYVDVRPPGGTFGGAVPAQAGGSLPPTIDFDAAGNALALSTGGPGNATSTLASFRPVGATSSFGAPQTLETGQLVAPPVASVNPSGAALAAWATFPGPGAIQFSDRAAGAGSQFTTPAGLPGGQSSDGAFAAPLVAPILDADGAATIAFTTWTGADHFSGTYTLNQVSRPAGGTFSATSTPIVSGIPAPHFGVNASGDAVALWDDVAAHQIKASYRPRGGTFGAPEVVASYSSGTLFSFQASSAAVDAAGRVLFAYADRTSSCPDGEHFLTHLRVRGSGAAGTWAADQARAGESPVLGLSKDSSRFVLLYSQINADAGNPCVSGASPAVVAFGEDGVLQTGYTLLPGRSTGGADHVDVPTAAARDRAGNALVVWRSGGSTGPYHAAAFDTGVLPTPLGPGTGSTNDTGSGTTTTTTTTTTAPPGTTTTPAGSPSNPPTATPPATPKPLFTATTPTTVRTSDLASVGVDLGCAAGVPCTFVISAFVSVGGSASGSASAARAGTKATSKAKTITLPKTKVTVKPGKSKRVKIAVPKKSRATIAAALKARKPVSATITVHDASGTRTVKVTYKRK